MTRLFAPLAKNGQSVEVALSAGYTSKKPVSVSADGFAALVLSRMRRPAVQFDSYGAGNSRLAARVRADMNRQRHGDTVWLRWTVPCHPMEIRSDPVR